MTCLSSQKVFQTGRVHAGSCDFTLIIAAGSRCINVNELEYNDDLIYMTIPPL